MLDEGVLPLPAEIAEKAKALGVKTILLEWQGGSDEGYLNVITNPSPYSIENRNSKKKKDLEELNRMIEAWAEKAWEYSGSGDGNDYGDDLLYDLEKGVVEVSEWFMERKDCELPTEMLRTESKEEVPATLRAK